jgi:hypothetical protein
MPLITTKLFSHVFFHHQYISIFIYQKCKSSGLQLYNFFFYLSILFLLCWEFIISSLSDLALTLFLTPPPYLHINNHVPPPPPICEWRQRLHSWSFRSPNCVKDSASTNIVKNVSASSAIFKQNVDGIHSARAKAGAATTIAEARRRPAASRASTALAPPTLPLPWRQWRTRTSAMATTTTTKMGTKTATEMQMRLRQRQRQDDVEDNDNNNYKEDGVGIRNG